MDKIRTTYTYRISHPPHVKPTLVASHIHYKTMLSLLDYTYPYTYWLCKAFTAQCLLHRTLQISSLDIS
jgi:hypothetical protein